MKTGILTSEFWLTLIVAVGPFAAIYGVWSSLPVWGLVSAVVAAALAAAAVVGFYAHARTKIKLEGIRRGR